MIRTTPELVAGIIELDLSISLTPFIAVASSLVDEIVAQSEDSVVPLDDDRLALVETWLSAHFYAIRDPRATQEHAGPVGATYQSRVDLGLNVTHYGQMAMILDSTGFLRLLSKGASAAAALASTTRTVGVHWLGIDPNEE